MLDYILHLDTRFDKQQIIDFKYKFMRSCVVMQQRESWIWSWESRKAPKRRQQRNETIVRDTSGIQRREDD